MRVLEGALLGAALLLLLGGVASILWWLRGTGGRAYPGLARARGDLSFPRVSIIVPARDEADVVEACLRSLAALDYPDFEVVLVDGGSTDGTLEKARAIPGVRVVEEPPLPPGWVGKSWACHTGAAQATGAYLLFTDADTVHAPGSLRRVMTEALLREPDLLTGYTQQVLLTPWERALMPAVFILIGTAVGGVGTRRMRDEDLAIANGQYLLFKREAYDSIGGHAAPSVRGRMAEDLALARLAAARGLRPLAVGLIGEVTVRMYREPRAMWRGWRKNTSEGMASTPPVPFLLTVLTYLQGAWALPLAVAAALLGAWPAAGVAAAAYLLMAGRILATHATTTGVPPGYALLHPLGFAFFATVLTASLADRVLGRGHEWKGRRYGSGK